MCMAGLGRYLFAGTTDSILRSEDGGETWAKHSQGLKTNWVSYKAVGEGVVYAGYFSGLFRSLDSGATWTKMKLNDSLARVDGLAARDSLVYVALDGGRAFLSSADRGETWSAMTPTKSLGITTLALAGEPKSLFAATTDGLHRSTDTGKTWSLVSDSRHYNLDREFYAVAKQGELIYAGGWGGAIRVPAAGSGGPVQVNFGLGGSPITGLGVSGTFIYAGYGMKGFRGAPGALTGGESKATPGLCLPPI